MKDINLEPWFHGRILREEAEGLIQANGCIDGLFLVREMTNLAGDYALSLAYNGRKFHYQITRHSDGRVAIEEGQRFEGPVELVAHHYSASDGLLTKLRKALNRDRGVPPTGYRGVSHEEMEAARRQAVASLASMGFRGQPHEAIAKFRRQVEQIVGAVMHAKQSWFHGKLSRSEAEQRMKTRPLKDGMFLVRERDQQGSYAICLCHRQNIFHYLLDIDVDSLLSITDGRKFDTLLAVVDHYSRKVDGLLCLLGEVVPCPNDGESRPPPRPAAHRHHRSIDEPSARNEICISADMPDIFRVENEPGYTSIFKESTDQKVFEINPSAITTDEKLGSGNFGSVLLGTYCLPRTRSRVQVAVKTLKVEDIPNQKAEILREAETMAGLDHAHIVRLVGVVKSSPMMLVMEIASLGPLHKYLKRNKSSVPWLNVMSLMLQVAAGMTYLEDRRFVHRDLAARNVLCVTPRFCKISDFGMSRALGLGNEYYRAEVAGRWPLKWYAPECIYFFKFDTKSDVWSYGVTMWEALSYGDRPYAGRKGTELLRMLEDGERLDAPVHCPPEVYQLMTKCWSFEAVHRPTFKQLLAEMESLCRRAYHGDIAPADLYLPMRKS